MPLSASLSPLIPVFPPRTLQAMIALWCRYRRCLYQWCRAGAISFASAACSPLRSQRPPVRRYRLAVAAFFFSHFFSFSFFSPSPFFFPSPPAPPPPPCPTLTPTPPP